MHIVSIDRAGAHLGRARLEVAHLLRDVACALLLEENKVPACMRPTQEMIGPASRCGLHYCSVAKGREMSAGPATYAVPVPHWVRPCDARGAPVVLLVRALVERVSQRTEVAGARRRRRPHLRGLRACHLSWYVGYVVE